MSEVVGGPVGSHGRPHSWWVPVRVLLALFAVVFALSVVQHQPCLKTNWSSDQARYAKGCYSDIPYLYTGRGFVEGLWPYADHGDRYEVMEYPVGISYLAWITAKVTQINPSGPPVSERHHQDPGGLWFLPGMTTEVNTYFLVTALFLCGFGLLATWFMAGIHRRRPWDALPFVLSPVLLMTGLINWDLMAVAFVAGALWAWSRDRPVLTGVMIGLGTAAKLYPLFLLGPILIVALRRRQLGAFANTALAAGAAWVLVNLPAWLTGPDQWKVFWRFNSERVADLGSVWLALTHRGHTFTAHTINAWSWALFGVICLAVAVLGLRARRTPRVEQLAFLVVVGLPAGEQGVLTAVRALAAASRRTRPAALARPAHLAGRRAVLPAGGVDLPRRLARGGGRWGSPGLRHGDLGAGGGSALPGRGGGPRRRTTRARSGRRGRPAHAGRGQLISTASKVVAV